MSPSAAPPLPEIPGYRIRRLIGRGGMASVYAAIEADIDREVAIKIVTLDAQRASASALAQDLTRLDFEARSLARLRHPHIVELYRFGRVGTHTLFYAMPLLSGGDLSQWLRPAPQHQVRQLLSDLLDALGYAHTLGVVHRDVKPENVLFDAHGRAQLADFGAAFALSSAARGDALGFAGARTDRLTQEGFSVGSLGYMSPEQARGQSVSGTSDLYSLAVVAYELLSDARCHDGEDAVAIALAQIERPPAKLVPALAHWDAFFARALQPNPALRFADAAAMKAALPLLPLPQHAAGTVSAVLGAQIAPSQSPGPTRVSPAVTRLQPHRDAPQRLRAATLWGVGGLAALLLAALVAFQSGQAKTQAQLRALEAQLARAQPAAAATLAVLQSSQLAQRDVHALVSTQLLRLESAFSTLCEGNDTARITAELVDLQTLRAAFKLPAEPAWRSELAALTRRAEETLTLSIEAFDQAQAQRWLPLARQLYAAQKLGIDAPLSALMTKAQAIPAIGGEFVDARFAALAPDLRWRLVSVPSGNSDGLAVLAQPVSAADFARFAQSTASTAPDCKSAHAQLRGCVSLQQAQAFALWLNRASAAAFGQTRVPSSAQWQSAKAHAPKIAGAFAISEECNQVTYSQRPNVAVRAWGGVKSVFGGQKARATHTTFCNGARVFTLDGSGKTAVATPDRVLLVLVQSLRR